MGSDGGRRGWTATAQRNAWTLAEGFCRQAAPPGHQFCCRESGCCHGRLGGAAENRLTFLRKFAVSVFNVVFSVSKDVSVKAVDQRVMVRPLIVIDVGLLSASPYRARA